MSSLEVVRVLLRESIRAAATPLRVLWWLPRRRSWVERSQRVLAAAPAGPPSQDVGAGLEGFFATQPPTRPTQPHVFVSAGEASGETHATHLMQACGPDIRFSGFGGQRMADAGAQVLYPLADHAIMGLGCVLKALPVIVRAFARYLQHIDRDRPDLIVLVDYPGLHLVMAEAARRRGIPVLHYVAPQYWAWGPWRMRRYRKAIDGSLTILPFEAAFFRDAGLPAHYIGHPLLDELAAHAPDPAVAAEAARVPTLVLLPGSRRAEIDANLPGMLGVARELHERIPGIRSVILHRNPKREAPIRSILDAHPDAETTLVMGELAPWLATARVALVKSGTGSLEAALHGPPTVVVYRVGRFGMWVTRRLLTVPFVAAANLIAGRRVVPEHVFRDDAVWQQIANEVHALWHDGPTRATCLEGIRDVRERLGHGGAADRAARIVRRFLRLDGQHAAR